MSTNLSLHGQERLQDTISWYARGCRETPFTLTRYTITQPHKHIHRNEKLRGCVLYFLQYIMQHNPCTVSMWLNIIIKLNHLLKQFASYTAIQRPALSRCNQTHYKYLWNAAWWIPHQLGCNKTIQHKCSNDFPHFNHMEIQSNTAAFQQYEILYSS